IGAVAAAALDRKVELVTADVETELEPGVTDLAVRPSTKPGGALRGARIGRLSIGIYRAQRASTRSQEWVLPSAKIRARTSMPWLRAIPSDATGTIECHSLLGMRDACVAGLGRAVLPACLAANDVRLVRCGDVSGGTPVWILSAATRRSDPALRRIARAISI